jgi:hypothetical protein
MYTQQHVLMLDSVFVHTFANFSSDSLRSHTLASLTAFFSRKPTTMPGTQLGTFNCSSDSAHRAESCDCNHNQLQAKAICRCLSHTPCETLQLECRQ